MYSETPTTMDNMNQRILQARSIINAQSIQNAVNSLIPRL